MNNINNKEIKENYCSKEMGENEQKNLVTEQRRRYFRNILLKQMNKFLI
jgi:hypothetical protein